jgi:cation-transporting ATPase 13A1
MSTKAVHIDETGRHLMLYTKGAPEVVEKLLSQVPENYSKAYNYFTGKGFRVLALASKPVEDFDNETLSKDEERNILETDLNFIGFFVCNSPLKEDTLKTIQSLQRAAYKLIMITGDNLFTAANVGQQLNFGKDIVTVEK